jgi:hypothetical protein
MINVFCDIAPYCLVESDRRFIGAYCLHYHRPDDGSSKHLWNVGQFLWDYTAQHPRRQSSSYSPPWGPKISQNGKTITSRVCPSICKMKLDLVRFMIRVKYGSQYIDTEQNSVRLGYLSVWMCGEPPPPPLKFNRYSVCLGDKTYVRTFITSVLFVHFINSAAY